MCVYNGRQNSWVQSHSLSPSCFSVGSTTISKSLVERKVSFVFCCNFCLRDRCQRSLTSQLGMSSQLRILELLGFTQFQNGSNLF